MFDSTYSSLRHRAPTELQFWISWRVYKHLAPTELVPVYWVSRNRPAACSGVMSRCGIANSS
jgi:hypothetical protein